MTETEIPKAPARDCQGITACPSCGSAKIALIGTQRNVLTCGRCGQSFRIFPGSAQMIQISSSPRDRGECRSCGRVLYRTWTGNGILIVHGPKNSRCAGSGRQPAVPGWIAPDQLGEPGA
jgi:RNA polymerase subunit RPABC4/transcription elongation factor Spt4